MEQKYLELLQAMSSQLRLTQTCEDRVVQFRKWHSTLQSHTENIIGGSYEPSVTIKEHEGLLEIVQQAYVLYEIETLPIYGFNTNPTPELIAKAVLVIQTKPTKARTHSEADVGAAVNFQNATLRHCQAAVGRLLDKAAPKTNERQPKTNERQPNYGAMGGGGGATPHDSPAQPSRVSKSCAYICSLFRLPRKRRPNDELSSVLIQQNDQRVANNPASNNSQ